MRRRAVVNPVNGNKLPSFHDDDDDDTSNGKMKKVIRRIDLFPNIENEVKAQTVRGGMLSILTTLVVLSLIIFETVQYNQTIISDRIVVDTEISEVKIPVYFNITWHSLSCADIEVVAMDVAGEVQIDVHGDLHKHRLNANGELIGSRKTNTIKAKDKSKCGSCYGAETEQVKCCNTCTEVKSAYDHKGWDTSSIAKTAEQCLEELGSPEIPLSSDEGCLVEGFLNIAKVAGNFHVALGTSRKINGRLVHQIIPSQWGHFNTSHTIHRFEFGQWFDGQNNPLNGQSRIINPHESETATFQYFIQIVPVTEGKALGYGKHASKLSDIEITKRTYQYTYTERKINIGESIEEKESSQAHKKHEGSGHAHPSIISVLPGTFFVYDISPFVVMRIESQMSFAEYLSNLFAIAGSIVFISRILHFVLHLFGQSSA